MDQTVLFNPFADWFGSAAPAPEGTALDLLTTVSRITVVRDPPSPLLKPSPIGVFLVPVPQANPKVLTLAPGRVLLASRQLAAWGPGCDYGFRCGVRNTHLSGECHCGERSDPHPCGGGRATGRGARDSPRR